MDGASAGADRGDASDDDREARWLVVSVQPALGADPLLAVDALRRAGAHAVEREGPALIAHLPLTRRADDILRSLEGALLPFGGGTIGRALQETDAEWSRRWPRRAGTVVEIGERLVVVAGEADTAYAGERLPVRVRPGVAFGAADHPTTRACLRLLEGVVRTGDRLADIGAGSAVLSIAAATLGADGVVALEADPAACAEARNNVEINDLDARVRVVRRRVRRGDLGRHAPLDGVVANVEFRVLMALLDDMQQAVPAGGWLVLAGVVGDEGSALTREAAVAGLALEGEAVEEGWWAGAFRRID